MAMPRQNSRQRPPRWRFFVIRDRRLMAPTAGRRHDPDDQSAADERPAEQESCHHARQDDVG
jgi:hypothetical protein